MTAVTSPELDFGLLLTVTKLCQLKSEYLSVGTPESEAAVCLLLRSPAMFELPTRCKASRTLLLAPTA